MLLPYGVNSAGELVYIDQVGRGRLTDVICPYCGGALLARKGQRVAHHFAHAGATCQPSARADDVIALPAYDRFGLNLSGREWEMLQGFHDAIAPSAARNYGWHNARVFRRLKDRGLITYNEWSRQDELTPLGRVPFGEVSLASFAAIQDGLIKQKHDQLEYNVQRAQPESETHKIAVTDLRLYRAQWRRVLLCSLYFLEISHAAGKLYKIGVTMRPLAERLVEITHDLSAQLGDVQIEPLRVLRHRGAIELYFTHRYREARYPLGSLSEYFIFDTRRNALSDLTRLGDKELTEFERDILNDDTAQMSKITVTVETPTHRREMPMKEYTIVCKQCGRVVTLRRYPGRAPTLCSDECRRAYERERDRASTRGRVKRYRQKRKSTRSSSSDAGEAGPSDTV